MHFLRRNRNLQGTMACLFFPPVAAFLGHAKIAGFIVGVVGVAQDVKEMSGRRKDSYN